MNGNNKHTPKNLVDIYNKKYQEYIGKGYSEGLSEACALEFIDGYIEGFNQVRYGNIIRKLKECNIESSIIAQATGISISEINNM